MSAVPRASIVIPAYDAEATIRGAVESALAQTEPGLEVVVVDDGSEDETAAVVESIEDERVSLIVQANAGPSAARNAGIERAKGEFVAFLDSDDLLLPGYLERMTGALDGAPDAGFAFTDAWSVDAASGRVRVLGAMEEGRPPGPLPRDAGGLLELLVRENFVYTAVTARTAVLREVGGYDAGLPTAEDYELWLRILSAGYGGAFVDDRLAVRCERSDSLTRDELRMYGGMKAALRTLALKEGVDEGVQAIARERIAELEREEAITKGEGARARSTAIGRRISGGLRARLSREPVWLDETPPALRGRRLRR